MPKLRTAARVFACGTLLSVATGVACRTRASHEDNTAVELENNPLKSSPGDTALVDGPESSILRIQAADNRISASFAFVFAGLFGVATSGLTLLDAVADRKKNKPAAPAA